MWKFEPTAIDLIFVQINTQQVVSGETSFGGAASDLLIDTGNRANDDSVVDQGLRVIDGSI